MRREDCQTKRLTATPTDTPRSRWTRFLEEITCGDKELAKFIVRLFALAITGLSLHHLIFFYGRGRNGKGVSLRLLEKILGQGMFATIMKPSDVEFPGSDNGAKALRRNNCSFCGQTIPIQLTP
jgi:phage/plasmid-associated DNA primase